MKKENTTSVATVATKNNTETVKVEQTNKTTADKQQADSRSTCTPCNPHSKGSAHACPKGRASARPRKDAGRDRAKTI